MNRIVLSICIPVYNQIEIVKTCITSILECDSSKYEVIVNDDGSTEPIEAMVQSFSDPRVKYYRNNNNLGHDRNIIHAFKNSSGKYALLLRARDYVVSSELGAIIEYLEKESNIAYLTTSAYNQDMIKKITYQTKTYEKGKEALFAHHKLYVHPSGSIYNISLLDLNYIEKFLDNVQASKYNFTVHSLIRTQLAFKGNFITHSCFLWIYYDTNESKDIAVNSSQKKISVYDTDYQIERYITEMEWGNLVVPKELKSIHFANIFSEYLYATTWKNKLVYFDRKMRNHYNYQFRYVICRKERKRFLYAARQIEQKLDITDIQYYNDKSKIIIKNKFFDIFKYFYNRIKLYIPLKRKIKKILYGYRYCLRKNEL